jgi:hypothetical protein
MLSNNISNKSFLQKLKVNNLETSLISNDEFNTLNNIDITQTIQTQINNLISSSSSGNLNNIITKNIYITKDTALFPFQLSDGTTIYFKISYTGELYCSKLYINNVLIDFSSFATLTNLLNYVSSSDLNTILNGYISNTNLNTILDGYISNSNLNSILNSYYQKTETWSKSDTTNEIQIRTGYTDGTTCKSVDDAIIEDLAATDADVAALDASLLALDTTVDGLIVDIGVLDADVATINADIAILDTTVGNHTISIEALEAKTIYMDVGTGIEGNFTNFANSIHTTNINPTVAVLNIGTSGLSLNNINIGTIGSTIFIGGYPYVPYNIFNGFSQW